MRILALDTATLTASVAVLVGDEVVAKAQTRASTHSESLLPLVDEMLAKAGLVPADLDAIACGAGPGSFTGLRIGMATAKGLAFALGKPLVLASSLAALAAMIDDEGAHVLAVLDARKREVYVGLYEIAGGLPRPVAPEVVLAPAKVPEYVGDRRVVVVGDGPLAYPAEAAAWGEYRADLSATPDAACVARLGRARLAAGAGDDTLGAIPTYIRASEAEIATPNVPPRRVV
jgi:tRNA threonylcarbamoyladenosine biosynthesis protein TsaB